MKTLLRNRWVVQKGGILLERGAGGGSQIVSYVFLKKSMFSLLVEYFFLSGKCSPMITIDLFFHVVYFLLENDILRNFFSSYSYF